MVWAVCGRSARVSRVGGVENYLTMRQDVSGLPAMDHGRRHQSETGVVMVVVPLKERLAKPASVLDGAEAIRKTWTVFQGAELAFRIRIVIGDMRTGMCFDHTQISQQESDGFGFHGRPAIGVHRELTGRDVLRTAGVLDQPLGQFGAFAVGDHPTDDVATKNIQDDVKMIDGPFHGAAQLGDVPAPQLVGSGGQQLRLLIRRVSELIAAFAAFAMRFQQPIHGANRAMKPAFIEQRRVDLRGRAVLKTLLMKACQHGGLFALGK